MSPTQEEKFNVVDHLSYLQVILQNEERATGTHNDSTCQECTTFLLYLSKGLAHTIQHMKCKEITTNWTIPYVITTQIRILRSKQ